MSAAAALAAASVAIQAQGGSPSLLSVARTTVGVAWLAYAVAMALWLVGGWARLRRGEVGAHSSGLSERAATHTFSEVLRRAAVVSWVTLPRFLDDPAAHVVVAFWVVLGLSCGYVFLEPVVTARYRRFYWMAAAVILLPWGLGISPHWPVFG